MSLASTRRFFRSLALVSLALLGACAKKADDPAPVTATTGMSWTADNTNYTATSADVTDNGFTMTISGIYTANGSNKIVRLLVPLAVGTYSTTATAYAAYYYMAYIVDVGGTSTAYMTSNVSKTPVGTVTVTTLSATEVIGTFAFTGQDISGTATKIVTNGTFNIKR